MNASKLLTLFFLITMTSELSNYLSETAGCIFECETTEMKLSKNIKKEFLSKQFFILHILSNAYFI